MPKNELIYLHDIEIVNHSKSTAHWLHYKSQVRARISVVDKNGMSAIRTCADEGSALKLDYLVNY